MFKYIAVINTLGRIIGTAIYGILIKSRAIGDAVCIMLLITQE
jgi:hypothetical protein